MRSERGLSWLGALGILLAGLGGFVAIGVLGLHGDPRWKFERAEDQHSLRILIQLFAESERIHASPDGRVDVYRMLIDSRLMDERAIQILRSVRAGSGPTEAEVRAGDYRSFPWERAFARDIQRAWTLGTGAKRRDRNVSAQPVLWEREPHHGGYLVAFTNGVVRFVPEDEFEPGR